MFLTDFANVLLKSFGMLFTSLILAGGLIALLTKSEYRR